MMGHREEIRTGDEMDAFSSCTRRNIPKRGMRAAVKTSFSRRVRREVKAQFRDYDYTDWQDFEDFVAYGEYAEHETGWWRREMTGKERLEKFRAEKAARELANRTPLQIEMARICPNTPSKAELENPHGFPTFEITEFGQMWSKLEAMGND